MISRCSPAKIKCLLVLLFLLLFSLGRPQLKQNLPSFSSHEPHNSTLLFPFQMTKKAREGTSKETSRNFHLCRHLLFQLFSFSFQRKNFPVQLLTNSKGKIAPYERIRTNNLLKGRPPPSTMMSPPPRSSTTLYSQQHQQAQDDVVVAEEATEANMTTMTKTKAQTPLSEIVEAFEELAKSLNYRRMRNSDKGAGGELRLDAFSKTCSLVSVLFSCLGLAFRFAESEYVAKVRDLVEASKEYNTLETILDLDVANGTVRTPGSHSRNLRRVRQGLDLIRALFEQFLSTNDYSLREAATTAYSQVCAPYHTWAVRTAVYAGMYTLPTRDQLLLNLNETEHSAKKNMKMYIKASLPVIEYIDRLYISRNISLDW